MGRVEGFMVVCRRRLDQNPDGSGSGSRVASVAQRHKRLASFRILKYAIGQSTCPETFLGFGTGDSAGLELSELFKGLSSLGDLSLRHEKARNWRQTEIKIVTCTIQKNSHCCIDYTLLSGQGVYNSASTSTK